MRCSPERKRAVVDAEFNRLDNPDRLWCVVIGDVVSGDIVVFRFDEGPFVYKAKKALRGYDCIVGHNFLEYDAPHLRRLLMANDLCPDASIIDTLVLSRLIDAGKRRHSVEALGKELGCEVDKVQVGDDEWDDPSKIDLYVQRCVADVKIQMAIFKDLQPYVDDPEWWPSIEVEHKTQLLCMEMHENGFGFDYEKASDLLSSIDKWMAELETQIIPEAPMKLIRDNPVILKRKKNGQSYANVADVVGHSDFHFVDGVSFHRFRNEPFNPRSAEQRVSFLNQCGWKPYEKTKGHIKQERIVNAIRWKLRGTHGAARKAKQAELEQEEDKLERYREFGWKVSEGNLATLPDTAPAGAKLLAQWLSLEGRRGDLVEWMAAYVPDSGRVHGKFKGIGAWTHRMAHYDPNQGNIFSSFEDDDIRGDSPSPVELVRLRYDNALRSCWIASSGRECESAWLTGTDASGIQLRILAHYVNDADYSHAVCFGRKEDGTDIHSVNCSLLGDVCSGRSNAKTFIYAWVLGAGNEEVARILQCDGKRAREAVDGFIGRLEGLRRLKRVDIPAAWQRRYFVGFDGRKVIVPSEHHVLAGMLQNGESVIMKHATQAWKAELAMRDIRYKLCNMVHDEWQTESYSEEDAHIIGQVQAKALEEVGKMLNLNVPLAGEYDVGRNWYETH